MPYRTKHGSHWHASAGCPAIAGHDIMAIAKTDGLSPCSMCCGRAGDAATSAGGADAGAAPDAHADGSVAMAPVRAADGHAADARALPQVTDIPVGRLAAVTQAQAPPARGARGRRRPANVPGCSYVGWFLDGGADAVGRIRDGLRSLGIDAEGLGKDIACPHVTLSYMPDDAMEGLFGARARLVVTAYGSDGRNEGVKVAIVDDGAPAELRDAGAAVPVPHITLSIAKGARAVDTAKLEFRDLPRPLEIGATYGGYAPGGKVITSWPQAGGDGVVRPPAGDDGMGDGRPSREEALRPMRNPRIPPDGLVRDVGALASRIASSNGAIVVMRGSAGCGKSTVTQALGLGGRVVSPDEIRLEVSGLEPDADGIPRISQRDNARVWSIAAARAQEMASRPDGAPVVIDAMHARGRDIGQWQGLAERTGRTLVVCDLTDVPREVARERNSGRSEWKQVPGHVIDRFYDAAESNTPEIRRRYPCVDRAGLAALAEALGW